MGHLINPISLRIGHFNYWEDFWYQKSIYYSEFLHATLKIKYFLIYYFSSKKIENLGFTYSHFELIKRWKNLYIRCYIYYGNMEEILNDFYSESFNFLSRKSKENLNISKYTKKNDELPSWFTDFLSIFFAFNFFGSINFRDWEMLIYFINLLKSLNFSKINLFLKNDSFVEKLNINEKKSFFIYLSLFKLMYLKLNKIYIKKDLVLRVISRRFLSSLIWYHYLLPFFKFISKFLELLLNHVFQIGNLIVKIYLISNLNLNSKFISRFIARKLEQGYSIKEIVTPLD